MDIAITKTINSKLPAIDFNHIPFGKYTSDHMFVMDYADGKWENFRIIPYQGFVLDPQSKALQYCQCIFEGMKVTMGTDGISFSAESPPRDSTRMNEQCIYEIDPSPKSLRLGTLRK